MAIALFIRNKNMSSLTNSLLGKRKPVSEFTGVAGVPTVDGAGPALNVKPKPQLRQKDPRDKKKIREDGSIIPDDAEEVATSGSPSTPTEIGAAETGLTGVPGDREGGKERPSNLLPTSLALVAPDCTPRWDKMLSPAELPKSERRPAPPAEAPQPPTQPSTSGPTATGMLKLSRPGGGTPDQSLESQARNLVSSVITESGAPGMLKTGDELLAQGKPMPDPVQSNSAGRTLKKFNFAA
jgi:hypothetical protein